MPRITHVAKAQQRFATIPVLDEFGNQPETAVMRRDGTQKTTKSGRPVFMKVTAADKSQPLDPYICDHCRNEIAIGSAYKHMTPKSGPYGGTKRTRHEGCPTWEIWEYSYSLAARLAQVQHDAEGSIDDIEDEDGATSAASDIAEQIREIATEKEEAAQNIEDGFQHETEQSAELADQAEQLNSWADEVEEVTFDDFPEPEEEDCETCDGTGEIDDRASVDGDPKQIECPDCEGACTITPDDPDESEVADWIENAKQALRDAVEACPL